MALWHKMFWGLIMAPGCKAASKKPLVPVYTPFPRDDLERIDVWGFARRIRRRSEAVRQLVRKGLASKDQHADSQ